MKLLLPILFLSCLVGHAEDVHVQYRILGLFQPDRMDDLRRQAGEMPRTDKDTPIEVKLVDVNYDIAVVTFRYDASSKNFKNRTPDQVRERVNDLLRTASRGAFGIAPLSLLKPDDLKVERIAVAGHDCKGCNFGLYRCVAAVEGVERATASFKDGHVTAWIDPAKTNREALVAALRKREVDVVEADKSDATEPTRK